MEYLEKNCTSAKDGKIALSNSLVELAIKVHNCPIKVTCDSYPGEVAMYTVTDLISPLGNPGPFENKFDPGSTYSLFIYPWKGVKVSPKEEHNFVPEVQVEVKSFTEKKNKSYLIKTPVVVTVIEEKEVSLGEYVGMIIHQTRSARGLTQSALSNLTDNKVSASSISQIETATSNPILSSLEYICEALGLDIIDLFPSKN